MSKQNYEGPKTCLQCGYQVPMGAYCDVVYLKQLNGTLTKRLIHGGPCGMKFIKATGIDFTRMAKPIIEGTVDRKQGFMQNVSVTSPPETRPHRQRRR